MRSGLKVRTKADDNRWININPGQNHHVLGLGARGFFFNSLHPSLASTLFRGADLQAFVVDHSFHFKITSLLLLPAQIPLRMRRIVSFLHPARGTERARAPFRFFWFWVLQTSRDRRFIDGIDPQTCAPGAKCKITLLALCSLCPFLLVLKDKQDSCAGWSFPGPSARGNPLLPPIPRYLFSEQLLRLHHMLPRRCMSLCVTCQYRILYVVLSS